LISQKITVIERKAAKMVNTIGTYLPLARNIAYGEEVAEHPHIV
jgi:hypothetical protein